MNIEIDLGQKNSFTPIKNSTCYRNSYIVGSTLNRYDTQNFIQLHGPPLNNIFSVKIIDNITQQISTEKFEYVLQLHFEKNI